MSERVFRIKKRFSAHFKPQIEVVLIDGQPHLKEVRQEIAHVREEGENNIDISVTVKLTPIPETTA